MSCRDLQEKGQWISAGITWTGSGDAEPLLVWVFLLLGCFCDDGSNLSPEIVSGALHSLAGIGSGRGGWTPWICVSRCLNSTPGFFPDLKVTLFFGSKAGDRSFQDSQGLVNAAEWMPSELLHRHEGKAFPYRTVQVWLVPASCSVVHSVFSVWGEQCTCHEGPEKYSMLSL